MTSSPSSPLSATHYEFAPSRCLPAAGQGIVAVQASTKAVAANDEAAALNGPCHPQHANRDAVPVAQRRTLEAHKRCALAVAKRQKPRDDRRHDDLRGAAGAVVAFDGDTEPLFRQRAAIDAFGAGFHEHPRTEQLHDLGTEPSGAGDVPRLLRA